MASTLYFLVFSVFFLAITQSVTSERNEWDVERSSVNPLAYTDEDRYFRDEPTESPLLRSQKRKRCRENEHYTLCDANCQTTCDNYGKPIPCPRICVWGCVCDFPLIRGPDRKCIKPTECPQKKQQAEAQQNLVTDLKDDQKTDDSPNSEKKTQPASKSNWPPIPIPTIPIPIICRKNEVLDPCPSSCPDDCNNFREKDRNCTRMCFMPGCVCKKGLVRSHDGKCIKPYECQQEKNFCPSGEEYSPCNSHCEEDCVKDHKVCPKDSRICVPGCTCKSGLVRGPDGICIYETECPTTPPTERPKKVCPENELYEECNAACQWNCSNIDYGMPCPRLCLPGCVCKESLVRGKYGKCVEKDECPKNDFPQDSYVTLNPPPNTDDDHHIPESATKMTTISEIENSQFEEIPPNNFHHFKPSHKCPPRQRWVVCGGHCQRNCTNKDDKDFGCRPVCIPGCICEEGLVKGPGDECIEKDKCPKSDPEEDSYVTLNPPPYTDDDYKIPESSTEIPTSSETENSQFEEIPPINFHHSNQFPFPPIPGLICGRDEILEMCPSTCPDDCNNYKDPNRKCTKICIPACICKKGLVRGPKGKCIKKEECPNDKKDNCKKGEIWSKCKFNCEKNCTNWALDLVCPDKCVSGCVCRPGLVRLKDKKCDYWFKCQASPSRYPGFAATETPSATQSTDGDAL